MRHAACLRSSLPPHLEQFSEWAEVDVQVLLLELEVIAQLFHLLLEQHEGLAEPLDLVGRERAPVDSPQRLALHQLADQLDEREHQLGQPFLEAFAVRVDAPAARRSESIEFLPEQVQVPASRQEPVLQISTPRAVLRGGHDLDPAGVKLYGGHGPVQTIVASSTTSSSFWTAARNASTSPRSTRYAVLTEPLRDVFRSALARDR